MSDPRSTIAYGTVIDLAAWRERPEHDPGSPGTAVARLRPAPLGSGRISRRVESELLAITGAVTAGLPEEAAERAERLAERLEHPSARRSG